MAVKNLYFLNTRNAQGWENIGETAVGAATSGTGWIVSTGSTLHSELQAATERAATTFTGTAVPDGTLDSTLKDAFRTESAYTGNFASGNWEFHFVVRAVSNGGSQDGRIRFRLFRSSDPNGAGATEITSAQQQASIVSNVSNAADFDSTLTFNPGAITLNNEYLFVQIAWERTGAGGMTSADILFRTGSDTTTGTRIITSDFTVPPPDPPVTDPVLLKGQKSFRGEWHQGAGGTTPTTYILDVDTRSDFGGSGAGGNVINNQGVGNVLSYWVGAPEVTLSASTTYYYRVRAQNGFGTSGNSDTRSLTTLANWHPSDIGGLVMMYDHADPNRASLADADPVSSWFDLSYNDNNVDQATSTKRPSWRTNVANGKGVVRFDGADDDLGSTAVPSTSNSFSMYTVAKTSSVSAVDIALVTVGGFDSNGRQLCRSGDKVALKQSNGSTTITGTTSINTTDFFVVGAISTTNDHRLYLNGNLEGSSTDSITWNNTDGTYIGSKKNFQFWSGDIAAVFYYDRALDSTERGLLEQYLADTYIGSATLTGQVAAKGSGKVTASASSVASAAATLLAAGAMVVSGAVTAHGASAPKGAGSMSVSASITANAQVAAKGAGTAQASASSEATASSAIGGSGALSAAATSEATGQVDARGAGSLQASGTLETTVTGQAALGGAGSLVVNGLLTHYAQANLLGAGTLVTSASATAQAQVSALGAGALIASASAGEATGQAALSGSGSLQAQGELTANGAVSAKGSGALVAQADLTHHGQASLAGAGTLAGSGSGESTGAADLKGAGSIQALSGDAAQLSGAGKITAQATSTALAQSSVGGSGSISVAATLEVSGAVGAAGAGKLDASATATAHAEALVRGAGKLLADYADQAALRGSGKVTASATSTALAQVALGGAGKVAVNGESGLFGSAILSGAGGLQANGAITVHAQALLRGAGAGSVGASATSHAQAVLGGAGFLAASGSGATTAQVFLAAAGAIVVDGDIQTYQPAITKNTGSTTYVAKNAGSTVYKAKNQNSTVYVPKNTNTTVSE